MSNTNTMNNTNTMSNTTTKTETKKDAKFFYDIITLTALKIEMLVFAGVLVTCVYKAITSFLL